MQQLINQIMEPREGKPVTPFMLRVGKTLSDTNNRAIADSKARIKAEAEVAHLVDAQNHRAAVFNDLLSKYLKLEEGPYNWMEHFSAENS